MSEASVSADELRKLEAEGKWMELVKALVRNAEHAPTGEQVALYLQIATLYQGRFSNTAEAIRAYERVLVLEPAHRQAQAALRALFEQRKDWERLLELEKGVLDRTAPEQRADKAVEVARVAASRLSKPDLQRYWWERVREYEPAHRQAAAELTKLYVHAERWALLAELLAHQAEHADGNDARATALRQLACVRAAYLGDRAAAIAAVEAVLVGDPRDAETRRVLAELRAGRPVAWATLARFCVGTPPPDAPSTPAPRTSRRTLVALAALAVALLVALLVALG